MSLGDEPTAHVVVRPIASPLALGFVGLGFATFVASAYELGWTGSSERTQVGLLILVSAPPLQALTAVFALLARDTVAATGMGILTTSWLAVGADYLTTSPGSTNDALGTLLLPAAAALALVALVGARSKLIVTFVIGTATARFAVTGIYQLGAGGAWKDVAGVVGVVLCGLALSAAGAVLHEDQLRRPFPLTFRRGRGRAALNGTLEDQVRDVAHEAGVREQL